MAVLKKIVFILLPVVLMTGCYEDFNPDIDIEPVLCMNSLITAGKPIEVQVSRTWLFTDDNLSNDHSVSDAIIHIYANGEKKGEDYIPMEGDHIRIVAESKEYGIAEAEVTVPYSVRINDLRWQPMAVETWRDDAGEWAMSGGVSFNLRAEMDIPDNPDTEDYYRVSYLSFYHSGDYYPDDWWNELGATFTMGTFQYDAEPIFSEHIGVFESVMGGDSYGFTFFTDRQFSGATYTLHLQFTKAGYNVKSAQWDPELLDCGYTFTLHSISKSYYDLENYIWQCDNGPFADLSEIGFGEPIWGYSNVSTGAGVVAAEAFSSYTINLEDFIKTSLGLSE